MARKLYDLHLGHSPLTDRVYIGTLKKDNLWDEKHDVTNEFITCVLARFGGFVETFTREDGKKFEVTAREIKE